MECFKALAELKLTPSGNYTFHDTFIEKEDYIVNIHCVSKKVHPCDFHDNNVK